jgi:hypothetical protein
MERQSVSSSNIESIGWENGILEVEFNWGGVYQYEDVPSDTYESLISAPSIGEYFDYFIKKYYKYSRIS